MPIVRVGSDLVYFAHVPKCAGSSIENYLVTRFGSLAFLDRSFNRIDPKARWSRTSPQHIDVVSRDRLFPEDFFRASFAIVRHPAARLRSSYGYEQKLGRVPPGVSFRAWLAWGDFERKRNPFVRDNHLRLMRDIVPQNATVFRLEDGLQPVVAWFDELEGRSKDGDVIAMSNTSDSVQNRPGRRRALLSKFDRPVPPLDEALCQRIYDLCPEDYERFKYGVFDPIERSS